MQWKIKVSNTLLRSRKNAENQSVLSTIVVNVKTIEYKNYTRLIYRKIPCFSSQCFTFCRVLFAKQRLEKNLTMRSNFYEMHKNVIIDNYVMLGKNKKTIFFLSVHTTSILIFCCSSFYYTLRVNITDLPRDIQPWSSFLLFQTVRIIQTYKIFRFFVWAYLSWVIYRNIYVKNYNYF